MTGRLCQHKRTFEVERNYTACTECGALFYRTFGLPKHKPQLRVIK